MKPRIFFTIIFIATLSVATGASAQKVYRCGQVYSQTPCPGAEVVDATDTRTPAQQKQTSQATARDARTASALEKDRLKQEKADLAANSTPTAKPNTAAPAKTLAASAPAAGASKPKKTKRTEPEFFTAQVPGASKTAKPTTPAKPAEPASGLKSSSKKSS